MSGPLCHHTPPSTPGKAWEGTRTRSKAAAPKRGGGNEIIWSFLRPQEEGSSGWGLESGQLKIHPEHSPRADGNVTAWLFLISQVSFRAQLFTHVFLLYLPTPDHGPWAGARLLSPTEGKGSGAVPSLFPWFCLCFQRAFKTFDDVWRLWEVRCLLLWGRGTGPLPGACGREALSLLLFTACFGRVRFLGGEDPLEKG